MTKGNRSYKSRPRLRIVLVAMLVLAVVSSPLWIGWVSGSIYPAAPNPVVIRPTVKVMGNVNASAIGTPLSLVGKSSVGNAVDKQSNTAGVPVDLYDSGHLQMALYRGSFANGTVAYVVTLSNISQQNITVDQLDIAAQNPTLPLSAVLQSFVVGCTHDTIFAETIGTVFPNGTAVQNVTNATLACGNIALLDSFELRPGESFSAYVASNEFSAANLPLNDFGSGVSYSIAGIPYEWGNSVGHLP